MQAGRFDRRIVIEQKTDARDGFGDPVPTWSKFDDVAARKIPQRGTEQPKADAETAEREVVLEIRYLPGLDETMRIQFEGFAFDIEEILEIGRREGQRIRAVARVA
jgi:SPP1 family predicted phage head-tail adaptor